MTAARHGVLLWGALVLPSVAVVEKYVGVAGVLAYGALVGLALYWTPAIVRRVPAARVTLLAATTWLIVVLMFGIVYPRANMSATAGSDDDDAHDVGVAALISGQSPYDRRTYLGNELSPLPGSYILAAPFVLTGGSARQALFWLPLFFLVLRSRVGDARTPLVLAWAAALSAAILHEIATGSSYSSNAIVVLLGMMAVAWSRGHWASAVFCGIAMCSRVNFVLLLAPLFVLLKKTAGARVAVRVAAIVLATAIALLLPFDPLHPDFPPALGGMARLAVLELFAPGTSSVVLIATSFATIALSMRVSTERELFLRSAAIQATPIVLGMVIGSRIGADVVAMFAPYGTFAFWFLVVGLAPRIEELWITDQPTRFAPM